MAPSDDNTDDPNESDQSIEETLNELSPSQLLVLKTLAFEGWTSLTELCKETRLPERTVKRALATLRTHSLIVKISGAEDGRTSKYNISPDVELPSQFRPTGDSKQTPKDGH